MFIRIESSLILIVVLQQESNILIKSDTLLEKNNKTVSFVFTDSLILPRKKKRFLVRTLSVARYIKYHKLHATKFVCNNYFIHKGFILKNHYAWKMKPVKIR